jgi:hypothetical protein
VSESRGNTIESVTNQDGDFVFPNIPSDTYTVRVTMEGFKRLDRQGIAISAGSRVTIPVLVIELGALNETVVVTGEAPMIQAQSGERSFTIDTSDVANLPVVNRGFREFVNLMPGVNPAGGGGTGQQGRLGGGGQDNIVMDGISIMDTGNNGLMGGLNIPSDMVAEVKVLTSGYQAEYGRSSGLQISAITKSGTNQFRGSIYDVERNSKWNANSWANLRNRRPKQQVDERDWGYTVGGPVGKPGGTNKLFFFTGTEYQPRVAGGQPIQFRFPTAKERMGDFSETRDQNGALFNAIYNPASGLPKTQCVQGGPTAACFQDGGVVGKIPIGQLYGPGMALLNQWPMPNRDQAPGSNYNYVDTQPLRNTLTYIPLLRLDYQHSSRLRISGKFAGRGSRYIPNPGALPGYTDTLPVSTWAKTFSTTANYTINNTTFAEVTYGLAQNQLGAPNISEYANRNNVVCPSNLRSLIADCTLGAISFVVDSPPLDSRYYAIRALESMDSLVLSDDHRLLLPPALIWSAPGTTSRLGAGPPSIEFPADLNLNRTQDVSISVTKLAGSHTLKAGFYINHSYKVENPNLTLFPQGNLNFGNDANNPLDSGYPFANAALGVFSTYGQLARYVEGKFVYDNIEWYVQDNWKVNPRLTLDYGLRFVRQTPQFDQFLQMTNFFIDEWSLADAPLLYTPGCAGASPCTGNARQALDPRTGRLLGPGTASLIGQAVLGSGDFANGIRVAGDGIPETSFTWPSVAFAPRLGGAYDVTGSQRFVVRGSFGIFYDRPDGNRSFTVLGNPPVAGGSTAQWGSLRDLGRGLAFGSVPIVRVFEYESELPSDAQWNAGVQMALPFSSSVDVAYVGHHAYNVMGGNNGGANLDVNINAIDIGAAFLAKNQDPTQPPGTALPDNLLRSLRGYDDVRIQVSDFHRTYHSLQTSFNRRFVDGLSFGVNWTLGLSDKGNSLMPTGNPQVRLDHNPDGTYVVRADQAIAERLFENNPMTRHIVKAHFVWDLPDWSTSTVASKIAAAIVNDWQLSGILQADSGDPYDPTYSYQSGGGRALTGSPSYVARIVVNGTPTGGCSSDPYRQFDTSVYSGPVVGSVGLESGRNLLRACGNRTLDLAIARTIRLGSSRSLQIRADVTNALNAVIFNARQAQLQLTSPTNQSIRNSQFLPDGSLDVTRVEPQNAGFGAATGARAPRTVQLQIRFMF